VTLTAILAPHRRLILRRVAEEPVALLLQDTTELYYSGKPIARTKDAVGPLNSTWRVGLLAHLQYVVTPDRRPLGVLQLRLWARTVLLDRKTTKGHKQQPLVEKESYRWYQGYRTACALQRLAPATQVVSVADREGDLYEVLVAAQRPRAQAAFLIRACQDRAVRLTTGGGKRTQSLRLLLHLAPVRGHALVEVPAGPGRTARTTAVLIHAQTVTFRPPHRATGARLPAVTVQAVLVREVEPPAGEVPIDWLLLTALPITTQADLQRIIQYYACRWEIEVFFRLWKSGCHVEAFQWKKRDRLLPCLALCAVLAWRVHWMTRLSQVDPAVPCTIALTEREWVVLALLVTKQRPTSPPSLATAVGWLATLGGFAGRRADGPPGPLVLMRGWLRVQEAFRLYGLVLEEKCV
jgi:hypothetical protein